MDFNFWAGIVIAAIISVPLSISANLYSDKVRWHLDRWRGLRLSKRMARELQHYHLVAALRSGDPVANAVLQLQNHEATRGLIMAFVAGGMLVGLATFRDEVAEYVPVWSIRTYAFMLSFSTIYLMVNSMFVHWRMRAIQRRIIQFDRYAAQIRSKWGDEVI